MNFGFDIKSEIVRDIDRILDRDQSTGWRYILDHTQFGQTAITKHAEFEYLPARVFSSFQHGKDPPKEHATDMRLMSDGPAKLCCLVSSAERNLNSKPRDLELPLTRGGTTGSPAEADNGGCHESDFYRRRLTRYDRQDRLPERCNQEEGRPNPGERWVHETC
jgi:hypothetical protein